MLQCWPAPPVFAGCSAHHSPSGTRSMTGLPHPWAAHHTNSKRATCEGPSQVPTEWVSGVLLAAIVHCSDTVVLVVQNNTPGCQHANESRKRCHLMTMCHIHRVWRTHFACKQSQFAHILLGGRHGCLSEDPAETHACDDLPSWNQQHDMHALPSSTAEPPWHKTVLHREEQPRDWAQSVREPATLHAHAKAVQ